MARPSVDRFGSGVTGSCGRCYGDQEIRCADDAAELETQEVLPLRILGRYRFTRCLGKGGMGTVYEAVDEKLDRVVAVKLMRARLFHDATARLRFEREAHAMVQINHPGVVTVFDSGALDDGSLFLVIAYLLPHKL